MGMLSLFEISLLTLFASPVLACGSISITLAFRRDLPEMFSFRIARLAAILMVLATTAMATEWAAQFYLLGIDRLSPQLLVWPLPIFIDHVSVVLLMLASSLAYIVIFFADRYMHRESGYHRYYATIQLLFLGFFILVTAGSLEMIFAGWEILALASFLMIGFYRHRDRSADHATRAFLTYRLCDVGLLIGAIIAHHLTPDAKRHLFEGMAVVGHADADANLPIHLVLGLLILIAATGKSAQFPFSGWLPRALEGPSHSSALFYGGLSIHAGVFLLLRTHSLWFDNDFIRILVGLQGSLSFVYASAIGRVQSTVKSQIAWAAIAQVGLMFVEIALGYFDMALIHLVLNASLRSMQLLMSSSALVLQFKWRLTQRVIRQPRWKAWHYAALNEFYIENFMYFLRHQMRRFVSRPALTSFDSRNALWISVILTLVIALYAWFYLPSNQPFGLILVALMSAAMAIHWRAIPCRFFNATQLSLNLFSAAAWTASPDALRGAFWAIALGINGGFVLLMWCLEQMDQRVGIQFPQRSRYFGLAETFPCLSTLMLLGFLGALTFPITGAFRAEDLLLESAFESSHLWSIILGSVVFVLQLFMIRVFADLYFGPNQTPELTTDAEPYQVLLAGGYLLTVYGWSFLLIG